MKFFRAHHTRSSSWQDKFAQGIGLLWDFGVQTKARRPDRNARDLLRDFALALVNGTFATDGSDPTQLAAFALVAPCRDEQERMVATAQSDALCHASDVVKRSGRWPASPR